MRSRRIVPFLLLLVGCEGSITGVNGGPAERGTGDCTPKATAVPKLLRLSNHEYRAMVADVLGTPVDEALFAQWTPVAQVYGFDTMSETRIDAQGLEAQLATAEQLAALALGTPATTAHCPAPLPDQAPACDRQATYSPIDDFSDAQGRGCWSYLDSSGTPMIFDNARSLWRVDPDQTALLSQRFAHPGSSLDAMRRWKSPVDGTVHLSGHFDDGDNGGGDGVLVSIRHGSAVVFTQDVPNGGTAAFELTLAVSKGQTIDFIVNRKANTSNDTTNFTAALEFSAPRKASWTWAACAEPMVARLASRAFRRPIRADELADYQALFTTSLAGAATAGFAEPVDEALSAVLQAVFMSPNFTFKPELVPGGLDAAERDFGVASRLSLYLSGSVADEPLWHAAGTGGLADRAAVKQQAERLLDQNLERFTQHFGGQWLDFREASGQPTVLGPDMLVESRALFAAVLREDLPPERLLKPGFTFASPGLAAHYGLSPVAASPFRITTDTRGGLLSQAAFLTRTANGSEFRRPIHRGLWVLTRLMCQQLPRLDPATLEEISASFGNIDRSLPLPEQMAMHRSTSTRCGGCHSLIDPVGLALEKYDAQGQWRDRYENGALIETNLSFQNTVVRTPAELADAVAASAEFRTCVATKLMTFGLNRGPREEELCRIDRLAQPVAGVTPSFKSMTIEALLQSLELTHVTP